MPSFDELYKANWPYLCAAARKRGVDYADIEDVVQDTYLVVHRRLPEFNGGAEPRTWMHAVLNKVCLNYHRTQRRRRHRLAALSDYLSASVPTGGGEIEAYLALDRFLASLDPAARELFVRARIEGETAVDIARERCINVNTLRSRLAKLDRALLSFRSDQVHQLLWHESSRRTLGPVWITAFVLPLRREHERKTQFAFAAAFVAAFACVLLSHEFRTASEPRPLAPSTHSRPHCEDEPRADPDDSPACVEPSTERDCYRESVPACLLPALTCAREMP